MSTPSISHRQLDANYDPRWGQGQSDYLTDLQAVAQAIQTRLKLFLAEWFADLGDGLPLWQNILGVGGASRNLNANTILLVDRILGTPYVLSVSDVQSSFDPGTRAMKFFCRVQTQFGSLVVSNRPQPNFPGPPPFSPALSQIILRDTNGQYWAVVVSYFNQFQSSAATAGPANAVFINDSDADVTYELMVGTNGQVSATEVPYQSQRPIVFRMVTQAGRPALIQVVNAQLLITTF